MSRIGRRFGLVFLGLALQGMPVSATEVISSSAELQSGLKDAEPGAVLRLAGGEYGSLDFSGRLGTAGASVTLQADDPKNPPRFSGMTLRKVENLVIDGLVFDYDFKSGDKIHNRPFQILGARNVTVRNSLFDGDVARGVSSVDDGFGYGFALVIRDSTDIRVENNEFDGFYCGVTFNGISGLLVAGNDVHSMRMDGLKFAQVTDVVIKDNHIHDFNRSKTSADHADMIQFWTAGTTQPSRNVTIRDNILNSGTGWYTQSIFMRNDMVDKGKAGPEMFYRDITIENNVIINAHANGITVGETDGLIIRNNTLIRNHLSKGTKQKEETSIPKIRVSQRADAVTIRGNVVGKIMGYKQQPSWDVSDNILIQDSNPTGPGYYDHIFVAARTGDPQNLASFTYRAGSQLDRSTSGAAQLRK